MTQLIILLNHCYLF